MTFITAMEKAFIDNGTTSAEELAAAETKANSSLISKINEKLAMLTDENMRDSMNKKLRKVPDLPSRTARRHALENVLMRIERKLMIESLLA